MMKDETVESLGYLRSGFRAKYLVDAVSKVLSGEIELKTVRNMPLDEARQKLMTIKGVGPKVADCALLFGFYRTDAFPKDVWVKRVMAQWYPAGLPECTKGIEGIAQQYLFHYIRSTHSSI
jgi:N-glycosylase/DNA lyase